tara:strand:- start:5833 stop:6225 length:393 start_codon:yes stop_codon:yes gene_type:complete
MYNAQFQIISNNLNAEERRKEVEWDKYFPNDKLSALWIDMRQHNWATDSDGAFDLLRKWFADAVSESIGSPKSEDDERNFTFILKDDKCCLSYSRFESEGAQIPFARNEEAMLYAFYSGKAMHFISLIQY